MFKSILTGSVLSAALASPASAQWVEQGSIADVAFRSGMYQRQMEAFRGVRYYNAMGVPYNGWGPNPYTPRCGGGGYYPPPAPRPRGYNYNNFGWGVNVGVGGGFGSGYGGGFNNFGWGANIGFGGNSGSVTPRW